MPNWHRIDNHMFTRLSNARVRCMSMLVLPERKHWQVNPQCLFVLFSRHRAHLIVGQKVRFLTFGGSVFVERFESLSGAANVFGKNASGETAQLSDQWTKGIAAAAAKKAPEEECEGVDSEEWS